jgi:hypothetical protein
MVMSKASPQTTMSFTPTDLDLIPACKFDIDKLLTECLQL